MKITKKINAEQNPLNKGIPYSAFINFCIISVINNLTRY